jgi:hypothetical protein
MVRRALSGLVACMSVFGVVVVAALALSASSALASTPCPNEAVRAESNINPSTGQSYSQGLPECRAYEMVSPLEKQGNDARLSRAFSLSLDGAVGWSSQGDFGEPNNFEVNETQNNPYLSVRTADGWATRSNQAPPKLVTAQGAPDFSPDLTATVRCGTGGQTIGLTLGAGVACARRDSSGTWVPTPYSPTLSAVASPHLDYEGGSSDLSTVIFQMSPLAYLLPSDTYFGPENGSGFEVGSIYEITGVGGPSPKLKLVNVTSGGESLGSGAHVSVGYFEEGQNASDTYQAVSADGSTIFFTASPTGGVPSLYARVGGDETVSISNPTPPACAACNPTPKEARFQGASTDGSKVFFTTEQQLLETDGDETSDLYEYDFDRPSPNRIVQLSRGGPGDLTPGAGADVQGVVRTSPDGSSVYFVAGGVLTTLPNANGQVAHAGADNMYVVDTNTEETKFVADLCSGAEASGADADPACPASPTTVDAALWGTAKGMAQVTPNGRYLVFSSVARLTADDVNSAQDVYRYDAQTGELVRVSIGEPSYPASNDNNTGANAEIDEPPTSEPFGGAFADANDGNRAIADDGSEVVFVTSASLQADDVNEASRPSPCNEPQESPGCDVYLWHDGVVSMISGGRESAGHESIGIDAALISPSGSDIYFATGAQLVGQDTDQFGDVYDARLDGGFPAPEAEASCTGEEWTCQGRGSKPGGASGLAGSATQPPGENLTPPPIVSPPEPKKATGKPLTRTQKLTLALKACRKLKAKSKRTGCEQQARKRYRPARSAKPSIRRGQ